MLARMGGGWKQLFGPTVGTVEVGGGGGGGELLFLLENHPIRNESLLSYYIFFSLKFWILL